jgi:hypothetical protein
VLKTLPTPSTPCVRPDAITQPVALDVLLALFSLVAF